MIDKEELNDLQQKWNYAFPSKRKKLHALIMVIWDNYLSENGDIRRLAQIRLKVLNDKFDRYYWRIPNLSKNNKPFGIRVTRGYELIPFELKTYENNDYSVSEICVHLKKLKTGDEVFFTIEYYEKTYIKLVSRNILYSQWEYNWVYRVANQTKFFEMRVYLPKTANVNQSKVRSTLSIGESIIKINESIVYIYTLWDAPLGNIVGCVPYEVPSKVLPATISLIAGLLLAIPLSIIGNLEWQWAIVVLILVTIGIYISHWLTEKLS